MLLERLVLGVVGLLSNNTCQGPFRPALDTMRKACEPHGDNTAHDSVRRGEARSKGGEDRNLSVSYLELLAVSAKTHMREMYIHLMATYMN